MSDRPGVDGAASPPDARRSSDAASCPLCGEPNHCGQCQGGADAAACWCRDLVFAESLLARVPAALRGRACICERCAQSAR